MQENGTITVNGTNFTLGSTYSFKGSVRGKTSSDGSGAIALSLDELKSAYSEYAGYYPKMVLKYYNKDAAYPYCLYYPPGFWGGGIHGWFKADIFQPGSSSSGGGGSTASQTIAPPLGGNAVSYNRLKSRYKKNGGYISGDIYIKDTGTWKNGNMYIKDSGSWK